MNQRQDLFNEDVTFHKVQGYRSRMDDESSGGASSGTYAEMVEEVEKVSEMLMKTQNKLRKSQNELNEQNREVQRLLHQNETLREKDETYRDEIERLNQEIADRDEGRARPGLEQRLRKAIEFLNKDLDALRKKQTETQDELRAQRKLNDDLKFSNEELSRKTSEKENSALLTNNVLTTCQKQLREAKEGSAYLVEEVAKLRDELQRVQMVASQKDSIIRKEVENNVKEKIKHDVRNSVTQQVTDKVTREVTAKMKAEREKELNVLREQIKRIVRENAALKSQIDGAEQKASSANEMEQSIYELKYELSRCESVLDETQREHELMLSKLETNYRMKIQCMKEEAAKDKWMHAAEIRKQMTLEREREIDTFTHRIEAMSRQTDQLIQRAEKEKEEYAQHVRQRISDEKQREIDNLAEKLKARTTESEQILERANTDKEAYAEQVRRELKEEHRRESNKLTYKIEVLTAENEALQKRIDAFEEELSYTWQENESHVDQLKLSQSDIKSLEDEIFKLKRKNQNLSTLVNRYKHDSEESSKELKNSKQLFREALLKSEEQNFKLKAKLKKYEPMVAKSKEEFADTLETLEQAKTSLMEKLEKSEEDNSRLAEQNKTLLQSLEEKAKSNVNESASKDWIASVKAENLQLKKKISALEATFEDDVHTEGSHTNEAVKVLENENERLKGNLVDMETLLQEYKDNISSLKSKSKKEIDDMQMQLQDTKRLLEQYRQAAKEIELSKSMTTDGDSTVSDDDTRRLNREIQKIDQMLELYKTGMAEPIEEAHRALANAAENNPREEEIKRLKAEVEQLTSMIENQQNSIHDSVATVHHDDRSATSESQIGVTQAELQQHLDDKALLEAKVEDLNYLLEKYRNELSKTSEELENTRQTLAVEGETAQQLQQRVQSLNVLLDTTEQNHAEHTKELAMSHRRYDEATSASKREIERLNEEIKNLVQQMKDAHIEVEEIKDEAERENERLQQCLQAAEEETAEWKKKLENLENELQGHFDDHSELTKELKRSKKYFNEALIRSEQEIVQLRHQIEVLAQANADYVEASYEFEATKRDLEQSLIKKELESKEKLQQMEVILKQTKEENITLLKRVHDSERNFRLALQKSEDEKERLQYSLDSVKRTFQMPVHKQSTHPEPADSIEESPLRVLTGESESSEAAAPAEQAKSKEEEQLANRLDDVFGERKKTVRWNEDNLEIGATPSPSNGEVSQLRGALKNTRSPSPPVVIPELEEPNTSSLVDPSDYGSFEQMDDRDEAPSEDDDDDFADVTTFEEAIRRTKLKIQSVTSQLGSQDTDDFPTHRMDSGDSSSMSTTLPGTENWLKLASEHSRESSVDEDTQDSDEKKKGVRWDLPEESMEIPNVSTADLSVSDTLISRESRETSDSSSRRRRLDLSSLRKVNDRRLEFERSMQSRTMESEFDHSLFEKDLDDDSTLDWSIHHTDDMSERSRSDSTKWTMDSSEKRFTTHLTNRVPPPGEDPSSPSRADAAKPDDETDGGSNSKKPASGTMFSSNLSTTFSYSSESSNGDSLRERRNPLDQGLAVAVGVNSDAAKAQVESIEAGDLAPSSESRPISVSASESFSRRGTPKSGFQRALEKASRRNWTKQELTQFLSKTGSSGARRMPPSPHSEERPFDEESKASTVHFFASSESREDPSPSERQE
eukprot:Nitzschia sp. Nitz4//scaffold15_size197535//64621//69621//NITZ4_001573-RA/size197535-processed-gene-0.13-mRNA-1//1//CDS//3329537700//7628//frame0